MKVRYTRGALKIVSAPTGPILSPVPNTNIFEAFEAKLKNMIGPGTSIPIRSGFLAQVFILNPRAFLLRRVNVSVILRFCPKEGWFLRDIIRVSRASRTCSRSIGATRAETAEECVYIRARKGPRADDVALRLDVKSHYSEPPCFAVCRRYGTYKFHAEICISVCIRVSFKNHSCLKWQENYLHFCLYVLIQLLILY